MNNSDSSSLVTPLNETINSVKTGVPKDHHYANTEGYLLQFYHLFPRKCPRPDNGKMFGVTNDEFVFITHLSRFDFEDTQNVKPTLATQRFQQNMRRVAFRDHHPFLKLPDELGHGIVQAHLAFVRQ